MAGHLESKCHATNILCDIRVDELKVMYLQGLAQLDDGIGWELVNNLPLVVQQAL